MTKILTFQEIHATLSVNAHQVTVAYQKACPVSEYQVNTYAANSPNEDRYAVTLNDSGAYFGIYDGHGGCGAVNFVQECLHSYIQDSLKKLFQNGSTDVNLILDKIPAALIQAYEHADKDFILQGQMDEFKLADVYTGACANTAYILGRMLYVTNSGDCRAVLGRRLKSGYGQAVLRYQAVQLSNDHTAETEAEKLRKEHPSEPNVVLRGAIRGNLEPSRAFGDALFKDKVFNNYLREEYQMPQPFDPPYVTVTPEVVVHKLEAGDSFLVLGTDGLWDFMTNEEVIEIIASHKHNGSGESNACTLLIEKILEKVACGGATKEARISQTMQLDPKERRKYHDDVTVIVVYFDENRFAETEHYQLAPEYLKPNPFHIKRNVLQRSRSWKYQ